MTLPRAKLIALGFSLLAVGCAATPLQPVQPSAPHVQALAESQALAVIDACLAEQQLTPRSGWAVELPAGQRGLSVDIHLDKTPVGIEWVSEQDRRRYGAALPAPDPNGQLRVVQARDGALILLLDQASYRYEPSGTGALLANRDLDSTEERLKRDVLDFIAYVKSQYAL